MSGSGTQPKFEVPQSFDITIDAPIDARERVSSLASIDTELVVGVRYLGMKVWIEDIKEYYYFPNDVNTPEPYSSGGSGAKYVASINVVSNTPLAIQHDLGTENISVVFNDGGEPIVIDYMLGDLSQANTGIFITIDSLVSYTGLDLTIFG